MRITIGEAMKGCRERTGMTQAEATRLSGVRWSSLSQYERGRQFPGVLNMIALADAYGVTLDELVGRELKRENDR